MTYLIFFVTNYFIQNIHLLSSINVLNDLRAFLLNNESFANSKASEIPISFAVEIAKAEFARTTSVCSFVDLKFKTSRKIEAACSIVLPPKIFSGEIIFESKSLGFINNSLLFETTFESPVNEISS